MDVNDDQEMLFESISALVDNELSPTEQSALITKIKQDASLLEKWRHFYIIRAVMRKKGHVGLSTDEFISKVMVHAEKPENTALSNQQNPEH